MRVFTRVSDWQAARSGLLFAGRTVGFVPTMGALHAGHLSLIDEAKKREISLTFLSSRTRTEGSEIGPAIP